jgi:hypothetical protein
VSSRKKSADEKCSNGPNHALWLLGTKPFSIRTEKTTPTITMSRMSTITGIDSRKSKSLVENA